MVFLIHQVARGPITPSQLELPLLQWLLLAVESQSTLTEHMQQQLFLSKVDGFIV